MWEFTCFDHVVVISSASIGCFGVLFICNIYMCVCDLYKCNFLQRNIVILNIGIITLDTVAL